MKFIAGIFKKSLLLLVPLCLVFGFGWYLRTESDFFLVRDLDVDVEFEESQEALLVSLKPELVDTISSLKGKNIWALGLSKIRGQLLDQPWVKEVELSRQFPNKIHSIIKLHSPSLLFLDRKNRIYPILENGEKLPQIRATMAPVAPILRNNNILKDRKALQKLIGLFLEVPSIGALSKENIESVDYNSVTGLTLRLVKGNLIVHLGEKNIQTKALQVLRVTDYLESQKQNARVIDASFTKKVLVRLRKRS